MVLWLGHIATTVGKNAVLASLTGSVCTAYTRVWRIYGLKKRISSSVSVEGMSKWSVSETEHTKGKPFKPRTHAVCCLATAASHPGSILKRMQ
jgi:hypothetical protein